MAGESPDKSKQRESSARPASGSSGPVPEPRAESGDDRGARDPRPAASRESATPSAAGRDADAATGAAGALPASGPESEGAAAEDEGAGAEDSAAPGDRGGKAGVPSDARLRKAVAAWAASADGNDEGEDGARGGTGGPSEGPEKAGKGAGGSGEAGKAGEGLGRAEGTEKDPRRAGSAARTREGLGKAGGAEEDPRRAGGAEKSPERTGKAAEAEEGPGRTGGAAKAGEGLGKAGEAGKGRAVGTGARNGGEGTGASGAGNGRAGASAATGGKDTGAGGTDAGKAGKAGKAVGGTDAGKTGKAVGGTDAGASGAEEDAGAGGGGRSAEPPVDQPTTVFKAVRPSGPAVDQPTTMLRLGDAGIGQRKAEKTENAERDEKSGTPKPAAAAGSTKAAKAAGSAPESDAERTSKFVALKPLDDPATRKPPRNGPAAPAAEATTALPRTPADATAPVPQVGPERTTQQPLPPKPPLDLLAELTNTPPPPPTPLRTLARRVKIWTPLVLLLVVVFAVVQAMRPLPSPELELTAKDSYTFGGGKADIPWPSSGQAALDVQGIGTFGSSGEQKPVPIASVAKVMTAYIILRDHPLGSGEEGPKIEIDQAAQDQGIAESDESKVKVYKGDRISQREALEGVLIASANNVARLLARWDAGSEKAFVQKMNDAAEDLGMTNTTYTDPSGLNNTTVSTAVDQVKLAKEAMKSPAFREVAAMMSYVDYKGATHPNWNQLVGFNNVVGIKTGTTSSALGNLVFAAKKEVGGEMRTIVGAVVRQPPGGADNSILAGALSAGDKLIRAAQGALESRTILKKGEVVGYVDDGLGGRTPVVATQDVKAVGWAGLTVRLTFAADDIPHTAKAGTEVGTLTVGDGGVSGAVKVPVALEKDLLEPGFTDKLTRIG
ncbi:hypothetical protein SUDANB58_02508 [Streptomyces sp. enrichment culture]